MTGYGGGPRSHCVVPVNTSLVRFAPAPRRVTSLFMLSPAESVKVPALRKTTCFAGHAAIAASIWAALLPGSMDAQIVVRFGIPPGMPAWIQSIAREGSRIPDHGSAPERTVRSPPTVSDMQMARAIPSDRVAQAFPTSRVVTVITAERPRHSTSCRSSRTCPSIPSTHRLGGLKSLGGMQLLLDAELLQRAMWAATRPQLTAFFTSELILASSVAVNSFSAKTTGHMAPSSRFAASLKPSVAYLVLNFCAGWKKQTTSPSLAYAGIPYQVLGERAGALALMIAWSRLAMARSGSRISAIFARTALSPSALSARGPRPADAFRSWRYSFIAARSSSVNPLNFSLTAVVLLADFCVSFVGLIETSPKE